MLNMFLSFLGKAIVPIVDGMKWLSVIHLAKKSAKTEEQNKNLEKVNEAQKKQIDIAARPSSSWSSILNSMRNNKR